MASTLHRETGKYCILRSHQHVIKLYWWLKCCFYLFVFVFEIAYEFTRLVSVDLKRAFFDGLDQHMPRLLELYADRKCEANRKLRQLMDSLSRNVSVTTCNWITYTWSTHFASTSALLVPCWMTGVHIAAARMPVCRFTASASPFSTVLPSECPFHFFVNFIYRSMFREKAWAEGMSERGSKRETGRERKWGKECGVHWTALSWKLFQIFCPMYLCQ